MINTPRRLSCWISTLTIAFVCFHAPLRATPVSVVADLDNTLFQYDPSDSNATLNSNGQGSFFSAGRTRSRNQVLRGLLHFDLSTVPSGMQVVPGSLQLQLHVTGVPRQDNMAIRPFWFTALSTLETMWGEGSSISTSGSGALAEAGDATWYHTSYDPLIHSTTEFEPMKTGSWPVQGAIGNDALSDLATLFGPADGMVGGELVDVLFQSAGMESDVNAWLLDPNSNFGWLMLGDEELAVTDESSKRDFASREHPNVAFHPLLTFEVEPIPVPEPGTSLLLCLSCLGGVAFGIFRRP